MSGFQCLEKLAKESPLFDSLAFVVGARHEKSEVVTLLEALKQTSPGFPIAAVMSKLGEGLKNSGAGLSDYLEAKRVMTSLGEKARKLLKRGGIQPARQIAAVRLLGQAGNQGVGDLLDSSRAFELQKAAPVRIAEFGKWQSTKILVAGLSGFSPPVREEVIEVPLIQ